MELLRGEEPLTMYVGFCAADMRKNMLERVGWTGPRVLAHEKVLKQL